MNLNIIKYFNKISRFVRRSFIKLRYGPIENVYDYSNSVIPKIDDNSLAFKGLKIAIYTCISGNYDKLKDPVIVSNNVDYYVFTDNPKLTSNVWKIRRIPDNLKGKSNTYKNRFVKLNPHLLLYDYDYVIYVDGSVLIKKDIVPLIQLINPSIGIAAHRHALRNCVYEEIKTCISIKRGKAYYLLRQFKKYKREGFPKGYGLVECPVLFTKIDSTSKNIYEEWWTEFQKSKCERDQVILPYVLFNNHIDVSEVTTLGTNVCKSSFFDVCHHLNE